MAKKMEKTGLTINTLKNIKKATKTAVKDLRSVKGGNTLMVINPEYVLNVELEVLGHLMDKEKMDGVVVTLTRPYLIVHRALRRHVATERRPYYVDPMSSIAGSLMGDENNDTKVFQIDGPFEVDRIYSALGEAVNNVAKDMQGDEHFVLVDNLVGIAPYADMKDIIRLGMKIQKGFKGSFVHKFIGLTKTGGDYYKKIYKKIKHRSDVLLLME